MGRAKDVVACVVCNVLALDKEAINKTAMSPCHQLALGCMRQDTTLALDELVDFHPRHHNNVQSHCKMVCSAAMQVLYQIGNLA